MAVLTIRTNLTYNSYKSVDRNIIPNVGTNYSQRGNKLFPAWELVVLRQESILFSVGLPFTWRHARNGLEGAEEGGFVGETRCQPYLWQLLVGFLHQLLGIRHTVGIDELHKRAVSLAVDAVGDVGAVRM